MERDIGSPTPPGRNERAPIPRIEAYQTGWETVIFDGENPLAWIASSAAVPVERHV